MIGVAAFWAGLYAFRSQKPAPLPPKPLSPLTAPGNVGLKEFHLVQTREGVKLWELKAETVEYHEEGHRISFQKVTLSYFPKDGPPIRLVGNQGNLDTRYKNMILEGEVILSGPEGYEVKAPSLYYRDEAREVSTEGMISLKGPELELEGEGLVLQLESQKVRIKKRVKMTLLRS